MFVPRNTKYEAHLALIKTVCIEGFQLLDGTKLELAMNDSAL